MENSFSENDLILVLIIIIGFLLAALIYLGFKLTLFKRNKKRESNRRLANLREYLEEFDPDEVLENCFFHPNDSSIGTCCICHKSLCKKCWREADDLSFCPEHLKLYMATEWEILTEVRTTPETTEESLELYRFKKEIWEKEEKPSFVITHYQIDCGEDHIESLIKYYIPKKDWEHLKIKFEKKVKPTE